MNNLQRYNRHHLLEVFTGPGRWCKSEDVAKLEATNAQLLESAEKVAERFDTDMVERLFFINKVKAFDLAMAIENLRAAIAKAKGEQP